MSASILSNVVPGHWETAEGANIAGDYANKYRADLAIGGLTDFALANAVFMADPNSFGIIAWQEAAKQRIRWLSVQLAIARASEA